MVSQLTQVETRNAELEQRNTHLEAATKTADERIARLTATIKVLERSRFGRRSERLGADALSEEQYALVFDEIATGVAAIRAQLAKAAGPSKNPRAPRPRKSFADHLERVEIVIEPEVPANCEGLERVLIGEDVSERLDVTPAKFRVIVTRRPRYVYKGWDGVAQATAPAPASSRAAFRRRRCWRRSRWRSMPMAFRSTARKRSTRATRSRSTGH